MMLVSPNQYTVRTKNTFFYGITGKAMLEKAEELHQTALRLTKAAFGEQNVQTAKHYGNLGRLYQSMKKYEVRCLFFSIKGFEAAKCFFLSCRRLKICT
jgi:Tetratricopeptide repeat